MGTRLRRMDCCGLGEMHGLWNDNHPEKGVRKVIERAATGKKHTPTWTGVPWFDDFKGYLIATTIRGQGRGIAALRREGFDMLAKFRNPNTRNTVTLWGRPVTAKDKPRKKKS